MSEIINNYLNYVKDKTLKQCYIDFDKQQLKEVKDDAMYTVTNINKYIEEYIIVCIRLATVLAPFYENFEQMAQDLSNWHGHYMFGNNKKINENFANYGSNVDFIKKNFGIANELDCAIKNCEGFLTLFEADYEFKQIIGKKLNQVEMQNFMQSEYEKFGYTSILPTLSDIEAIDAQVNKATINRTKDEYINLLHKLYEMKYKLGKNFMKYDSNSIHIPLSNSSITEKIIDNEIKKKVDSKYTINDNTEYKEELTVEEKISALNRLKNLLSGKGKSK